FQLDIPDPVLLYDEVIEIDERIGVDGQIVHPLTQRELRRVRKALRVLQPESIAIALLHAYAFPEHERMLAEAIRTDGWPFVSVSHELSPTVQLLPRAQTTLVNAYLAPVLERYLMGIAESLSPVAGRPSLRVMTSSGGLVEAGQFHPKDSLLSGPAGGVVGAARIGKQLGYTQILTLDMGGTSTDTARYDGNFHYELETAIGGVRLRNPALAIETVAAGGGSICAFDGHRLQVGPESAGAFPGPACYGAGGPLTVTDVNLLLGKLEPSRMGIPIDRNAAEQKLEALRGQILSATGQRYGTEDLLRGLERIADEKMADAMRQISVAQGFDPGDHAMLVFGGAGGMHACGIADLLQIQTIILPYEAGLLSAYGIGNARVERLLEQAVLETLDRCQGRLPGLFRKLATEARQEVVREGFEADEVAIIRQTALLRLRGQD
ncbi:MAG: hydantoinase/oxoprolinase family protein, partial [Saprospiraceae bacterium]|nr:hydantoinase/oxoprolinase family protein [Saprospiraceae bacterium]